MIVNLLMAVGGAAMVVGVGAWLYASDSALVPTRVGLLVVRTLVYGGMALVALSALLQGIEQ